MTPAQRAAWLALPSWARRLLVSHRLDALETDERAEHDTWRALERWGGPRQVGREAAALAEPLDREWASGAWAARAPEMTHEEIGAALVPPVGRQAVAVIEARAIAKLRKVYCKLERTEREREAAESRARARRGG